MKQRLDILVAEKLGLSRSKAQALIMAGNILVDGKAQTKSGQEYDSAAEIEARESLPYVSRGALKMEGATREFEIDFTDRIVADIGASTGGFTDFVLQHGARRVYAIDCGYGQLDQKLRQDKRVINMERTNIKKVASLPEPVDIFVIDVSFISLRQVLPQVISIAQNSNSKPQTPASVVALIKPQFEVGKKIADKFRGIITDSTIQQEVVTEIKIYAQELGYIIEGVTESPIKGAKGNVEFLLSLKLPS